MNSTTTNPNFFESKVLGHPSGLFVLFFTEMWERFSFYGMRVLLILFLTAAISDSNPGWGWDAETAAALFGTYAMLLYITPIFGGIIADKYWGYRWAVLVGSILMTLGHAAMALDTPLMLYIGLGLLVVGTGFFKPNMTSILSEMYKDFPEKKDGAFTIFYMGVNAGAFFGMLLCGYLAKSKGWHWGFGLAGIFMLLGTLQFWLAKPLFGNIGNVPSKEDKLAEKLALKNSNSGEEKRNPFTLVDKILIVVTTVIGLLYAFNDPISKIGGFNIFNFSVKNIDGSIIFVTIALLLFLYLIISRIVRYTKIVRDRMIAVVIFAFFTIFFWMSFEQGASSLVMFAKNNVDRELHGESLTMFNIFNTLLTVIPLLIISWVLFLLAKQTYKKALTTNIILAITFIGVWAISGWMLYSEFTKESSEIDPTWFSIMNSFFIITFASVISKIWDSKYNPPAAVKYGLGLIIMAIGFGLLAYSSHGITNSTIKVSMLWLIFAYLFHTLGELFLSPVGLSYVSKLVPTRMIAFMFGMWYLAIAIGNKLAAVVGGKIDKITEEYSLSHFFLIFTIIPVVAGIIVILLNPVLKRLMHGVK